MYYREKSLFEKWHVPELEDEILRVIMAFDVEYQPQVTKMIPIGERSQEVKQRRLKDIISMQIAFNYRNMQPVKFFIHRNPDEPPFIFCDILQCLKQYLKSIHQYKLIQEQLKAKTKSHLTVELWGFFMGVDLSSLQDWQDILTEGHAEDKLNPGKIVTLHANTVFTSKPLNLNVRDHYRHPYNFFPNQTKLVLRDETKLAPGKSNLAKLGDLVGAPKMNTEDWDRKYHKPVGYYKEHMSVLWKEHPELFIKYAMKDTVITALYGSFILEFQKQLTDEGLGNFAPGKLKASLGSIIANVISQKNAEADDWICEEIIKGLHQSKASRFNVKGFLDEITNFKKASIFNEQINNLLKHKADRKYMMSWLKKYVNFDAVRKGYYFDPHDRIGIKYHRSKVHDIINKDDLTQSVLFNDFLRAYSGGYNVVHRPGIIPDGGYKSDIDEKASYNTSGHLIADTAPGIGSWGLHLKNLGNEDFKKIVDIAMKINGPYTIGTGVFSISYPKNYHGFVITPQRLDDGPRYFRNLNNVYLTFTDAYIAWICGAKIFTHRVGFSMQTKLDPIKMHGVCNEGIVQDIFQQKRSQYSKDDPMNIMYKNVGNQAYGTTGQGLREKHPKDFKNNQGYYLPFSSITSPLKAAQFTAIARYHIILLQKAVWKVDPTAKFLNNVTDGFLVWTKDPLDYDNVNDELNKLAHPLYRAVVKHHFNGVYFEPKDGSQGEVANLRTRLTFSRDGQLHAMVGINANKLSPTDVFEQYLDQGEVSIPEKNRIITGLVDMRHQVKFDHLQNSWETPTELPLGYDFAQWPVSYHNHEKFTYWDTRPYNDAEEFLLLNKFGQTLAKYAPFYSSDYAKYFKATLDMYVQNKKLPKNFGDYLNDEQKNANEIYYAWALYVSVKNLNPGKSYQKVTKLFKQMGLYMTDNQDEVTNFPKLNAFEAYVKRHSNDTNCVINYVLIHLVGLI